jgi:GTP-binding protein EngB required for normal cell division
MNASRQFLGNSSDPGVVGTDRARLRILADIASSVGAEPLARQAQALAQRVAEERFFVACIGQFKRGKSTLLNALVGSAVLPTGVVPVTAVVTVIRHGSTPRARVHLSNGARHEIAVSSIGDYVSEEHNPLNRKGVSVVEVFFPSPLLASGMCLVDTPGIGSVFAGNTAVTREFVPHIDAALVVIGADPPISGDELDLIEEVSRDVTDILLVLNKADRLVERDCDEAVAFARRTLSERLGRPVGPVFRVSAYQWLNGSKGSGPSRDEALLRDQLERLARESGAKLVAAAEERGLTRLAVALLRELDGLRDALLRPIADSRRLVEQLSATIADAERSLNDLAYLFKAEQERVSGKCAERREKFLAEALPAALMQFHEAIGRTQCRGFALRSLATALAQEISRDWLDRWLSQERPAAEQMYRQSAERFVGMANEFLERLADSGGAALADLPRSVTAETGFTKESRLYYAEHFGFPRQTFLGWLGELFHTRQRQVATIEAEVRRYLDTLLTINSTRILNDLDERVRDSARRLEAQIRWHLKEVRDTARRTLEHAARKQSQGAEAVRTEIERIDSLREQLFTLLPAAAASAFSER